MGIYCYFRLQVISTDVGGIHEVLPKEFIQLAQPTTDGNYDELSSDRKLVI